MKRLAIALVAAGLVAAPLTAPSLARRKKPKPPVPVSVDLELFLRQDSESCQTPHTFLSVADGPDLVCFYHDAGAPYEVANQVEPITTAVWAVEGEGIPVAFDAAKKIRGEITIHGGDAGPGPVSAGQARFDLVVLAEVAGGIEEVGSVSETWTTTPGDVHVVELGMAIDPALAGKKVTAFEIHTTLRGLAVGPHTIELDDPASFVVVPTLK